jgi:hypothetical protein
MCKMSPELELLIWVFIYYLAFYIRYLYAGAYE